MPLSAVIHLEAINAAELDQFTGRGAHGFWFQHWARVDPSTADRLHQQTQESPYTLSPLLGLPAPRRGLVQVTPGMRAHLRVTALSEELETALKTLWLPALAAGSEIAFPAARAEAAAPAAETRWRVLDATLPPDHSGGLAGQTGYLELARPLLVNSTPPRQWRLEFLTPTAFHGKNAHLPFPLPDSLIGSWLRRWQAFAPLALPADELLEQARGSLAISAYQLQTYPAREGSHLRVGCVGWLALRALDMPPYLRACIDLLAAYALFCGSGSHTAQGMGQTRLLERR